MSTEAAASAAPADLLRLVLRLARDRVGGRDPGRVVCRWARDLLEEKGGDSVRIRVARRTFLLVGSEPRSLELLSPSPAAGALPPGDLKRNAMSFLAPQALTIAHGEEWSRLRSFHDKALVFGPAHPFTQAFLERTRAAFAQPVRTVDEVRAAMGRAMLGIVLGEEGTEDSAVPDDVHALFQALQSPLRRRLGSARYRAKREALYALLRERLEGVEEGEASLVALARRYSSNGAGPLDGERLVQQLPHWMFTFTGSGTDLLARTLAMVTARPPVHRRIREELAAAGPPEEVESVFRLAYVRATLLETGRLFPPVTRTFHRGVDGEVVHYFPLLHRDDALDPTVHHFRPERWSDPDRLDSAAASSSLFLRGPRACPGRELILFVCMAALARQVGELGLGDRNSPLSRDPLPITFPAGEARFQPGGRR